MVDSGSVGIDLRQLRGAAQSRCKGASVGGFRGTGGVPVEPAVGVSWFGAVRGSGGGIEDLAQGIGVSSGVVALRLPLVAQASAHADDGDGGVGQAGEVAE